MRRRPVPDARSGASHRSTRGRGADRETCGRFDSSCRPLVRLLRCRRAHGAAERAGVQLVRWSEQSRALRLYCLQQLGDDFSHRVDVLLGMIQERENLPQLFGNLVRIFVERARAPVGFAELLDLALEREIYVTK